MSRVTERIRRAGGHVQRGGDCEPGVGSAGMVHKVSLRILRTCGPTIFGDGSEQATRRFDTVEHPNDSVITLHEFVKTPFRAAG